ncbi:TLDc domain-containing protein [Entamoeba marina]
MGQISSNQSFDKSLVNSYDKSCDKFINSNCLNVLQNWSDFHSFNIIYDSDVDGGGYVAIDMVHNKKNLYFINFDNENNVFGGFVSNPNSGLSYQEQCNRITFVFSLERNGLPFYKKYPLKKYQEVSAFNCYYLDQYSPLYTFGCDLQIFPVGVNNSFVAPSSYKYNHCKTPFINRGYPYHFPIQRLIILEMS